MDRKNYGKREHPKMECKKMTKKKTTKQTNKNAKSENNKPIFATAYGPKIKVDKHFQLPSRTKQSFKDECQIDRILAKYVKTGILEHVNKHQASYGEVSGQTFHEAMNTVIEAQAMFMDLPATIRDRFANDPGNFLDFVANPANSEEMQEMGLIAPVGTGEWVPAPPVEAQNPQSGANPNSPPDTTPKSGQSAQIAPDQAIATE